jgi:hypothetical protein
VPAVVLGYGEEEERRERRENREERPSPIPPSVLLSVVHVDG